jgi:hypothetical protein
VRPLLYLLSAFLVLPAAALATFFEAVTRAAAYATLGSLLGAVWRASWRLMGALDALGGPWALLVLALGAAAALGAFVALAWSARYRWVGWALIGTVGAVGTLVVVLRGGLPRTWGEALFHAPALVAIGLALWQLATDPRRPAVGARA